jgi:hypothetical protein
MGNMITNFNISTKRIYFFGGIVSGFVLCTIFVAFMLNNQRKFLISDLTDKLGSRLEKISLHLGRIDTRMEQIRGKLCGYN